ncbi:sugar transferase [Nocardioides mangrovicus]|nr:sugar transferase [Nocardioides mangrovicus]
MTLLADRERLGALTQDLPSRASRLVPFVALVLDLLVIAGSLALATAGRSSAFLFARPADLSQSAAYLAPIVAVGWVLMLVIRGAYAADVFGVGTEEYRIVLAAGLLSAGLLGVGAYLLHVELSRGFFSILFLVGIPAMLLARFALRRLLQAARRRGALGRSVMIMGHAPYVDLISGVLGRQPWLGLRVVGCLTPDGDDGLTQAGVPVVGPIRNVAAAIAEHEVDVLVFAPGAYTSPSQIREAVWELEGRDVEFVVAPSMTDISSERIKMRPVGGLPLIHVTPPTWTDASRWGKRTFDVVGALFCLAVLSPVLVASAAWVKLHDGGPVLFRQRRTGRHGEEFSCLKFRSMVPDAERRLTELTTDDSTSVLFKMKRDPRVTRPGRVLRRFSIDELPQLINVLRGEMSLVGPRPPLPSEVSRYEGHTARRLHVRPGLTGLWQVSGRSDLSWEEAVRLDLYYVDNWSMIQDLNILLKTVGAVVSSRGAY